jgi:signal peptidase I
MLKKLRQILKVTLQGILVILISISVALFLRIFLFASFKIPSLSMVPTIEAGDYILVNKLIPGPRVYKNFDFLKGKKVETRRFKGSRPIKRNDVLVFNFPYSHNWNKIEMDLGVNYIKRCIAIPGDTFFIDNGIFKVKNASDTLGHLLSQQQLSLKKEEEMFSGTYHCFPYDTIHYNWNIKDFGPLYVPRAGDRITLDTINYRLYRNLIEYETDQKISIDSGQVYLDGQALNAYSFRQNYYFMSGDWVWDSKDSRYWGLLPEDHIIGKAWLIWKSKDPANGKHRWKRFFKSII